MQRQQQKQRQQLKQRQLAKLKTELASAHRAIQDQKTRHVELEARPDANVQLQFHKLQATCDASGRSYIHCKSQLSALEVHHKSLQEQCTQYQLQVGALEAQCNALTDANMMFKVASEAQYESELCVLPHQLEVNIQQVFATRAQRMGEIEQLIEVLQVLNSRKQQIMLDLSHNQYVPSEALCELCKLCDEISQHAHISVVEMRALHHELIMLLPSMTI